MHRITDQNRLSLFLETKSLSKYVLSHEKELTRILGYDGCELFNFFLSSDSPNSNILDNISQFVVYSLENNKIDHILIGNKNRGPSEYTHIHFAPEMMVIEEFADKIYDKDRPNSNELNSILEVFIHSAFILYGIYQKNTFAFVTQNRKLLENREWLEKKLGKLNIMTIQETSKYMDLYAKRRFKYYIEPCSAVDKETWYWNSFRTKIPYYNVPERESMDSVHVLEGFASRFLFLLLAVDEIGMQTYFPKDPRIMVPYHFYHFLSLATGIFDNLAIETKSKYDISFKDDRTPSKISLSKSSGRDFLRKLRSKNLALRNHISNYSHFIYLINEMRQTSIHKEGFRDMTYQDVTGVSFFFEIMKHRHVQELIKRCKDKPSEYDKFTNWGIFDDEFFIWLEPYRFVIAAANQIIKFCDRYLELMGFEKFVDGLPIGDHYGSELESFSKYRIGF